MTLGTWIHLVLFILLFPALWLFAGWLDRVWGDTTELLRARGEAIRQEDIPE